MPPKQIEVYGTTWCPDCARAKRILDLHKTKYRWFDIEADKKLAAYVESVNGGFRSVPTIVFPDGSVLVEPTNAALEKKLAPPPSA